MYTRLSYVINLARVKYFDFYNEGLLIIAAPIRKYGQAAHKIFYLGNIILNHWKSILLTERSSAKS